MSYRVWPSTSTILAMSAVDSPVLKNDDRVMYIMMKKMFMKNCCGYFQCRVMFTARKLIMLIWLV